MSKGTYIIAEIGANHNGSLDTCMSMIRMAYKAGADAVKFQKRDLDLAIPEEQKGVLKETPWGVLPYIEYRRHLEFNQPEFDIIAEFCEDLGIDWFGSAWDIPSAEFLLRYEPKHIKVPSAKITDIALLRWIAANSFAATVISTGMSDMVEIRQAVTLLPDATILHCNSTYPCPNDELNLRTIRTLKSEYHKNKVGYSGHERGIAASVAAVALGAKVIERHFTLDRSMWGTDQAASLEPSGFARMVKDIRVVDIALGAGIKRIYPGEKVARDKLRGNVTSAPVRRS